MLLRYTNDWNTPDRRVIDCLPHDLRRFAFRLMCPQVYREINAMRYAQDRDPHGDLSMFIKRKAIFVHVPKAAGRSVRAGLFEGRTASHMTLHHYQLAFSRREFRSFFKFAFVRNPWDWVHSAYRFLMAGGAWEGDALLAEKCIKPFGDFERFVMKGLGTGALSEVVHFYPASHFLEVRPGISEIDFIGRFENFREDFVHVAKRLGVSVDNVPWENKTCGPEVDYRSDYTREMIEKVAEVYSRDLRLYHYTFDPAARV